MSSHVYTFDCGLTVAVGIDQMPRIEETGRAKCPNADNIHDSGHELRAACKRGTGPNSGALYAAVVCSCGWIDQTKVRHEWADGR